MASLIRDTHPLTLKVMRLSRPTLADARQQLVADSAESVLAPPLRDIEQNYPTQSGLVLSDMHIAGDTALPLDALPLTETLVLPRAFGTMYLGETFLAHLCICNESSFVVREVGVQVAMQTATQQLALLGSSTGDAAKQQLAARQPLNLQVTHEIKELGAHVLGCSIVYLSAQGERRTLQKSFKFQVANPLVVKTKVNHLERDVLLEVQVHNATQGAMALERLRFEPAAPFAAEDLSAGVFGSRAGFVNPGDVRQYLYRLHVPTKGPLSVEQERAIRYATAMGKLDILWRGAFGSVGRLQTSQLLRKSPGMFLLETDSARVLGSASNEAAVEEPFVACVRVRNVSERHMAVSAVVTAHKHPMVIACGPVQHDLGSLGVGEVVELNLEFLALAPGVQRVGALVLVDSLSGYTREIDHLLDVLVRS